MVRTFTLGLDDRWKEKIVELVPDSERALDLGCGTGILTECLAKRFPRLEIVGVDLTPDYLAAYDERLRKKPWIRARSVLGNAETVTLEGEFDVIVSSYLAKYVDADRLVANITPHLKTGGAFIAHDFTFPTDPLYRASWSLYTRAMNRIGPALFPEWHAALGEGFGLIRRTRWQGDLVEALRKFGYCEVHRRRLSFESAGLVWATRG